MSDNIVLIGMPGCGKSTLGIVLAKMLCMDFVDVDLVIQKKIGTSLQNYIDENGVDAFLRIEAETVCELDCSNTVIATGGSAVLCKNAAEYLRGLGKMVYIDLCLSDIERRITNMSSRGIARRSGESLDDIYKFRRPIYEKYADIKVNVSGNDIASNCRILCELLSAENGEKDE